MKTLFIAALFVVFTACGVDSTAELDQDADQAGAEQTDDAALTTVQPPSWLTAVTAKLKPGSKAVTLHFTPGVSGSPTCVDHVCLGGSSSGGTPAKIQTTRLVITADETITKITAVRAASSQVRGFQIFLFDPKGVWASASVEQLADAANTTRSLEVQLPKGTYFVYVMPTDRTASGDYSLSVVDEWVAGVTPGDAWRTTFAYTALAYSFSPALSFTGLGGSVDALGSCDFKPATMVMSCAEAANDVPVSSDGYFSYFYAPGGVGSSYWPTIWIEGFFLPNGRVFFTHYTHNHLSVAQQGAAAFAR